MNSTVVHYDVVQAVTPHDSNPNVFKGFMVNVAGNVAITDTQGNTNTLTVLAGVVYNISVTKILSTGTTATGIFGLT